MQPVELVIGRRHRAAPLFATEQLKGSGSYRTRRRVRWRRARLPEAALVQVRRAARAVFSALEFRDYGRVDFRLAPDGRLVFIEANPNPDLHPHAYGNHFNLGGGVPRAGGAYRRRVPPQDGGQVLRTEGLRLRTGREEPKNEGIEEAKPGGVVLSES